VVFLEQMIKFKFLQTNSYFVINSNYNSHIRFKICVTNIIVFAYLLLGTEFYTTQCSTADMDMLT